MAAIDPMLVDFDVLAPLTERPPRRRIPRQRAAEVAPTVPLWDDEVLARIERDRADAVERDGVILSLTEYEQLLADIELVALDQVSALGDGTEVFVAGRRMSRSREGSSIVVTLRDGSGLCDILFAPDTLAAGELVLVAGVTTGGTVRASESWDLRDLLRRFTG